MDYKTFLESKRMVNENVGIEEIPDIHPDLFDFQSDVTRWALRKGRAAVFCDTGLGKTRIQLEWAKHIHSITGVDVLILAPLAVAKQTIREGQLIGVDVRYVRSQDDVIPGITIANYEMLHAFDSDKFGAVVLDESGILKSYSGVTRNLLTKSFASTPYKLACTATPAPNDTMELGMHSEFLGVMRSHEVLSVFFDRTADDLANYHLKPHARAAFWEWLASWAAVIRNPKDLGYTQANFDLPPLDVKLTEIQTPFDPRGTGMLFDVDSRTLNDQRRARKASLSLRVAEIARLVNDSSEPWIVWCDLNAESDALTKAIPDAVEVRGSDSMDDKEQRLDAFARGDARVLVTKARIAGRGLNLQHCSKIAFCGISHSFEGYYQAIRRCWRFGQKSPVSVHIINDTANRTVFENVKRKEEEATAMFDEMLEHTREAVRLNLKSEEDTALTAHETDRSEGMNWTMHLGDSCEVTRTLEPDSLDFSIFSPPFMNLFCYSRSERDMCNSRGRPTFFEHFGFLIEELRRVMKPGRIVAVHCQNLRTFKGRDGKHGFYDFRGDIVRAFEAKDWIFHSEVCIWKCPVSQMQRTKAHGLLYKNLKKDSTISQQGLPDYMVMFRKPGDNAKPVTKTEDGFPLDRWQKYASPIWDDINDNDVLNSRPARGQDDIKHLCPLQLGVIARCVELWTNPGETVFSPFAGVGSEGFASLRLDRKFVGIELKREYWEQANKYLKEATAQTELFK